MLSAASASFARWDVAWHLAACAQYLELPVNAGICVNVKKFLVGLVFFFVSNFRELCPKATQRLIPYSTRIFFSLPNKNQYSWNVDGRNLFCSLSDVNGKKGEGGGLLRADTGAAFVRYITRIKAETRVKSVFSAKLSEICAISTDFISMRCVKFTFRPGRWNDKRNKINMDTLKRRWQVYMYTISVASNQSRFSQPFSWLKKWFA